MNGNVSQLISSIDSLTGDSQLLTAVNEVLAQGVATDINMNGHAIVNAKTVLQSADPKTIPTIGWVQSYVTGGVPGSIPALNIINQGIPLTGTLDLSQNSQQTLVSDCPVELGSKRVVNSETLATSIIGVQGQISSETLRATTAEAQLQSNINTEISRATSAETSLQSQITTQGSYSLATIASTNPSLTSISASNQKVTSILNGTTGSDAVALNQLQSEVTRATTAETYLQTQVTATNTNLSTNYSTTTQANTLYLPKTTTLDQVLPPVASVNMNSQRISSLANGVLAQDAVSLSQVQALIPSVNPTTIISSNSSASMVCNTDNSISVNIVGATTNPLGKIFIPSGQSTKPLCVESKDKLQLVSDLGSVSSTSSGQAIGHYVGCNYKDSSTYAYSQLNCYLSGAPTNTVQSLSLASSYVPGNGAVSTLSNDTSGAQMNLLISPGTPTTNNTLYLYGDVLSSTFPCQSQFNRKTGYSSSPSVAITESTQFTSKAYVDNAVAKNLPSTSSLATISAANASASSITVSSQKIINLASGSASTDAANVSNITSALVPYSTTAQATALYRGINDSLSTIASSAPCITAVSLNSQKITSLATPTVSSDAATKGYVDGLIPSPTTSFYTTTLSVGAQGTQTITHGLGASLNNLNVSVYIRSLSGLSSYNTSQWISVGTMDSINASSTQVFQYIVSDLSTPSTSSFQLTMAPKFNLLSTAGVYVDSTVSSFAVKVNVSVANTSSLVVPGSYATSNLTVNSNIDCLSSYTIKNLLSPSFSGDAVPLTYLQSNYMLKEGLDTISISYPCTGPVTLNSNRLQGVATGINNDEAINLAQLNGYYPIQCISQDSTVTMSLIGASNARMNGAQMNYAGGSTVSSQPSGYVSNYIFTDQASSVLPTSWTGTPLDSVVSVIASTIGTDANRYALQVVAQGSSGNAYGKALQTFGFVNMRLASGLTSSSVVCQAYGHITAPAFDIVTPSSRDFKAYIRDYDDDDSYQALLAVRPKRYQYTPAAQSELNVDDSEQQGFIREDIPVAYQREDNTINRSELERNLLYMLLIERVKTQDQLQSQAQRITILEAAVAHLLTKVQ